MESILVTGGAGYIGSILVEELLSIGYRVVVLDNLHEGHLAAVLPGATFIEGDLSDRELLGEIFAGYNLGAVIHMAAETTIEFSMTDPSRYFRNNVMNGINLLDVMLGYGVYKMVFSSTAAVYGEPISIPIKEDHPVRPINAYGESKQMFEKIMEWYHRAYGLKYVALRYFNAARASDRLGEDHRHESHLIPLILKTVLIREKRKWKIENGNTEPDSVVKIYGTDYPTTDGSCIRDYIHVKDLAKAHILSLEKLDELDGRVYNLGNGTGYSVLEVLEVARKVTMIDIPTQVTNRRPGDPPILVANSDKIRAELGWEPKYPELETIIETAWEWKKKHPYGYRSASGVDI